MTGMVGGLQRDFSAVVLFKHRQNFAGAISVHLDNRLCERSPAQGVGQVGRWRNAFSEEGQHPSVPGPLILQREVDSAYPICREQGQHPFENGVPALQGDVLKDDERVHEIEFPFEGHGVIAFEKAGICDAETAAIAFSFPDHGNRNVDAEDSLRASCKRNSETANAAAEVKSPSRRERTKELCQLFGQILNECFARLEKFLSRTMSEFFGAEHGVVRPSLAEQFPISVSGHSAESIAQDRDWSIGTGAKAVSRSLSIPTRPNTNRLITHIYEQSGRFCLPVLRIGISGTY